MIHPSLTVVCYSAIALAVLVVVLVILDLRASHRECPWWVRLAARLAAAGRARPIYVSGLLYLERFYLLGTSESRFALVLHRFHRGDDDRHLHDHPWPFLTWILSGGYWEERIRPSGELGWRFLAPGRFLFRSSRLLHRVALDQRAGEVWTLVLMGPRHRDWGFLTEDGWVDHEAYFHSLRAGRAKQPTATILRFPHLREDDTPRATAMHDSPEIVLEPGWPDAEEQHFIETVRPS